MMDEQNELIQLLKDGFFNDSDFFEKAYVGKNGKVDMESLSRVWEAFKGRKYSLKYYMVNGNTIPTWGVPSKYRDPDEAEKLYKECMEENTTWQDKLGYKTPPEGTLL